MLPWKHSIKRTCQAVGSYGTCECQIPVGADVPSVIEEAGYGLCRSTWLLAAAQEALTVIRCYAITPFDVQAVEVVSIQTGVWKLGTSGWPYRCDS